MRSANIVDVGGNVQVCIYPSPAARGPLPPFIGQGEAVYNHAAQFKLRVAEWCTVPWSG
jgi:hypothetical protein